MTKKIKDMTPQEREVAIKTACAKLQAEFEHPATQQKLAAILRGEHVGN